MLKARRLEGERWVLHDYLQVNGGAERLVLTLARRLPGFRLAVSGMYPDFEGTGDLSDVSLHVMARGLGWLPRIARALYSFRTCREPVVEAECVIYSGLYAPLAARHQQKGVRAYYCHTAPRFAFDRTSDYLRRVPPPARPALRIAITSYRRAYMAACGLMDVVLVNSKHVAQRLRQQLGLESEVVYPPVDCRRFTWRSQGDYYLSLGRLEPNKRVDRVIRAFLDMPDKKLVVASGGSQYHALRQLAKGAPNIRFTGWLHDSELEALIANSIACLYVPADEDFGMSAIEAMSAGKPVITADEGGLKESVVNLETGLVLPADPQNADIGGAVRALSRDRALSMRPRCEARAAEFSEDRFIDGITQILKERFGLSL